MPITIKELLASDTISQAADKINFNFDQLLLNGGGPVGPIGPLGNPGPIGGRGLRGTIWYEDPNPSPGTDPNTLIFAGILNGDSYLQSDGAVWTYNGTVWVISPINLTGPSGTAGLAAGLGYFGNNSASSINGENVLYATVMPNGISAGASIINEGIPVLMVGGVSSISTNVPTIPFTSAYKINDSLAISLTSQDLSILVHQKNTGSRGIVLHGGDDGTGENFEQSDLNNLSNIKVGLDDRLILEVPKNPTNTLNLDDLIGFRVDTIKKSQAFRAGKAITIQTGTDANNYSLSGENDMTITVNGANSKFRTAIGTSTNLGLIELGGNITFPNVLSLGGRFIVNTGEIFHGSNLGTQIVSNQNINVTSKNGSILNTATTGNISNIASGIHSTQANSVVIGANVAPPTAIAGYVDIACSVFRVDASNNILLEAVTDTTVRTTSNGTVNIESNGTGNITINSDTGSLDIDGANMTVDVTGNITMTSVVDTLIQSTTSNITLDAEENVTAVSQDGNITINALATGTGSGRTFIGAQGPQPTSYSPLFVFPLQLDGHLTASTNHTSPITLTPKYPAILSGTMQLPTGWALNAQAPAYFNWQKMGSIITVTGQLNLGGTDGTDGITNRGEIPLPVLGTGGTGGIHIFGTAVALITQGVQLPNIPLYVKSSSGSIVVPSLTYALTVNLGDINSVYAADASVAGANVTQPISGSNLVRRATVVHVSFSYRIS